jgi:hypothetical protein
MRITFEVRPNFGPLKPVQGGPRQGIQTSEAESECNELKSCTG